MQLTKLNLIPPQFVTNLALSHCEIETLEPGAFEGLDGLLELKLESNKLNYLQGSGLFPKSLHHLQVTFCHPFSLHWSATRRNLWLFSETMVRTLANHIVGCNSPLKSAERKLNSK
jgi:hypothetical protein